MRTNQAFRRCLTLAEGRSRQGFHPGRAGEPDAHPATSFHLESITGPTDRRGSPTLWISHLKRITPSERTGQIPTARVTKSVDSLPGRIRANVNRKR